MLIMALQQSLRHLSVGSRAGGDLIAKALGLPTEECPDEIVIRDASSGLALRSTDLVDTLLGTHRCPPK